MGPFVIKYHNNFGEELNLTEWPYYMQSESLVAYDWDYRAVDTNRRGGKISNIYRNVTEKDLSIMIHASSRDDFWTAMQRFFEVVEKDVLANTPGRLIINGEYYMTGFILQSGNQYWSQDIRTNLKGVKFVTAYPFWCKETLVEFHGAAGETGGDPIEYPYLDYTYDYTYDYFPSNIASILVNKDLGETPFELRIYGPATNPRIQIGSNVYQLEGRVPANSTLVINSRNKTIICYHPDGTRDNWLSYRTEGIFNPIPPGNLQVLKNMDAFDIVLYEERSEPPWNLS